MERCETCQHWQRNEHETGSEFGLGRCKAAPMFWDATDWDEECNRVLIQKYAGTKAFVQDGSDYSAKLLTKPDFGCVMHVSANARIEPNRPR